MKLNDALQNKIRSIPKGTAMALWAKSAGRCEICKKILYENENFGEKGNFSQKAHIRAFSEKGPRHNETIDEVHNIDNLMLLCYDDHHMIDNDPDEYTIEKLIKLKKNFEDKIESSLNGFRKKTAVVFYSSNISKYNQQPLINDDIFQAVVEDGMFNDKNYFDMSSNIPYLHQNKQYFNMQKEILLQEYSNISTNLSSSKTVSVFAIAPQPLLIYLGYLLNDENDIRVFQRHRSGDNKWAWKLDYSETEFFVETPDNYNSTNINEIKEVNLNLSISADISQERVDKAINKEIPTFKIKAENPGLEIIKSKHDIEKFINIFRSDAIEKIKQKYPYVEQINFFPAMPVSIAVKIGMNYMKNIDVEWIIYNHNKEKESFIEALTIGGTE